MMLKEITAPFENHRVITYNYRGDKAVYHNIPMKPAFGNIYIGESEPTGYGRSNCVAYAYFQDKNIGITMHQYSDDTEIDNVKRDADAYCLGSISDFIERIRRIIEAGSWVTLLEVELLINVAPELVDGAYEARRKHRERLDEQNRIRKQKETEEEEKYVKEQNEKAEAEINKALDIIRNGGLLINKEFSIYEGRYDRKDYCVITYFLDKYGISMPIRTRAWVINSLATITIGEDGAIGKYQYYKQGRSKGSTTVWKYLEDMIKTVRAV